MSKRTNYANDDPITLACGCDGCNPSMVNGVLCHEHGCPEAWRDAAKECDECGGKFYTKSKYQKICEDCANSTDWFYSSGDDDEEIVSHPETFTITIEIGNGAFRPEPFEETARILREIADKIERGDMSGNVLDANGNGVGKFLFE